MSRTLRIFTRRSFDPRWTPERLGIMPPWYWTGSAASLAAVLMAYCADVDVVGIDVLGDRGVVVVRTRPALPPDHEGLREALERWTPVVMCVEYRGKLGWWRVLARALLLLRFWDVVVGAALLMLPVTFVAVVVALVRWCR